MVVWERCLFLWERCWRVWPCNWLSTSDCRQASKPSRYVTSHSDQLSLAIRQWISAVTTGKSWDVNRHTARCISPVFVVWQCACKLVSGCGLIKQRLALLYAPHSWKKTLRFNVCTSFQVVTGVAGAGNITAGGSGRNATLTALIVCCAYIACWSPNEVTFFLNFFGYTVDFAGWF